MDSQITQQFLLTNFEAGDRLALVALHRATNDVKQRVATTERIVQDDFQRWLRFLNKEHYEIYVSMNTLREGARGRKKTDIAEVRHVYLDFDDHGTAAVQKMMAHSAMPQPNHLVQSSPGKWQAIWRVRDFAPQEAEHLMRQMVREFGADPAAVDSARVLRLPGFFNHKYDRPHLVTVENRSSEVYTRSQFPELSFTAERHGILQTAARERRTHSGITQSERDWAFARRALKRGEDPEEVVRAIAQFRSDKPNPQYYAEHTVQKARASVEQERRATPRMDTTGKSNRGVFLGLW